MGTPCTLYDRRRESETNGVRSKVSQPVQALFGKVYRFLLTKKSQSGAFFSQKLLKTRPTFWRKVANHLGSYTTLVKLDYC
jgi:hypothetical protein